MMLRHAPKGGRALVPVLLATGALLAACQKGSDAASAQNRPTPAAVARGVIAVEGGLIPVAAPRDGLIAQISVEEGTHVDRGAVLAQLDTERDALLAAQARAETAQQKAAWRGAQARAAAAQGEAARLARLASADAATRREAEQARQAATAAAAQSDEAARAVDVARARQRLAELEQTVRTVRAPVSGLILRRTAAVGSAAVAASGTPLFVLAPDGPRVVRAELDEAFVDRVMPGAVAWVTDASGGGRVLKARVLRISPSFEAAVLDDQPGARADGRVLRLILAFDEPNTLRLGQRVLARIGG
ncbi:HlyD family efflux transporter periplasmic adaptor subunit [Caulobacter sp. BK020]|uniref:HlyD family efflux transporter periplasmic adaptor subunit n=1 Tax=Caulobacter sp. BK020 TaxID=2512117 RepID=UPI00104E60F1|nr:HlyD family efflux transporter periplasmic adaptor subunit [Caulobacter sp. BK020]TCS04321.1 biotin/lipoyl-binding protein [Caulobacter sp. BK020]